MVLLVVVASEMVACGGGMGVGTVTVHVAALAVASVTVAWEDDQTSRADGRMMVVIMVDMGG